MQNYYFDSNHPLRPFTFTADATPSSEPPDNALRIEPPEHGENQWPGESKGAWVLIADYRQKQGFVNGEPHTISDFGPLPESWSDTAPPTTDDPKEARINEIKASLADIDMRLTRPMAAIKWAEMTGVEADSADLEVFKTLMDQKFELQAELAGLTQ